MHKFAPATIWSAAVLFALLHAPTASAIQVFAASNVTKNLVCEGKPEWTVVAGEQCDAHITLCVGGTPRDMRCLDGERYCQRAQQCVPRRKCRRADALPATGGADSFSRKRSAQIWRKAGRHDDGLCKNASDGLLLVDAACSANFTLCLGQHAYIFHCQGQLRFSVAAGHCVSREECVGGRNINVSDSTTTPSDDDDWPSTTPSADASSTSDASPNTDDGSTDSTTSDQTSASSDEPTEPTTSTGGSSTTSDASTASSDASSTSSDASPTTDDESTEPTTPESTDEPTTSGASATPSASCQGKFDGTVIVNAICSTEFTLCIGGNPIIFHCEKNLRYSATDAHCVPLEKCNADETSATTSPVPSKPIIHLRAKRQTSGDAWLSSKRTEARTSSTTYVWPTSSDAPSTDDGERITIFESPASSDASPTPSSAPSTIAHKRPATSGFHWPTASTDAPTTSTIFVWPTTSADDAPSTDGVASTDATPASSDASTWDSSSSTEDSTET